jgi:hypothetical protein
MKAILTILAACFLAACGAAPSTSTPLSSVELKYRLMDQFGPPAYCDRDQYPVGRPVTPDYVDQQFASIRTSDPQTYQAILKHYHWSEPINDQQKLQVYADYKRLNAIQLQPNGDRYDFVYAASQGDSKTAERIVGTIDRSGSISVTSRTPFHLNCPICLAASTMIDTPEGPRLVSSLRIGMPVWTANAAGQRQAGLVLEAGSTPAPPGHELVHLMLADGRQVWVSPGHPTADGRRVGDLTPGQRLDGSRVVTVDRTSYVGATYDVLPSGPTGAYWADGILLASTLRAD